MVLHELFGLVYKSLKGHLSIFCVNPALGDSSLYPERNFQTFINSPSHTASWNIISETSFDLVVSIENRFRFSVKKYYNFFTTIQHFKIHDFKVNFWNLIFLTFMPMYCVKFQSTLLDFFTFDIWLVVLGSIIPVLLPLPGLYNFSIAIVTGSFQWSIREWATFHVSLSLSEALPAFISAYLYFMEFLRSRWHNKLFFH